MSPPAMHLGCGGKEEKEKGCGGRSKEEQDEARGVARETMANLRRTLAETISYNQHKLRKPQILCFGALLITVIHGSRRGF